MPAGSKRPSFPLSLARLIRLPNIFTAPPDLLAGIAAVDAGQSLTPALAWAILASLLLYISGMIWNDWFDIEQDRLERPNRPLPAGDISPSFAMLLASITMLLGVAIAWSLNNTTGLIATLLAISIVAYDGLFKSWPIAPFIMGLCRSLNFLLGSSVAVITDQDVRGSFYQHQFTFPTPWGTISTLLLGLALANGLYIAGVTLFARQEAKTSSRPLLYAGASLVALGLLLLAACGVMMNRYPAVVVIMAAVLSTVLAIRLGHAIQTLAPKDVQAAIKTSIFGLVVCNAITTTATDNPIFTAIILLHLVPAILIGRWLYST
jgi:4-hydroxybenzoate polyprenyltransferase